MVQEGFISGFDEMALTKPMQQYQLRKPVSPYVCSTPGDFQMERDFLAKKIFPDINVFCQQRGSHFSPVDIQWSPSDDLVSSGHLLRLCLDYISKCSPYFICLLGESYGPHRDPESQQLPKTIYDLPDDMHWLDKNYLIAASAGYQWVLQDVHQNCSVPELEILQASFLLDNEHCHFYFRQPEHLDHKFPKVSGEERERLARPYLPENEYADLNIRDLKQRIVKKGLPVKYFKTPEELGNMVLSDWTAIINVMYPPLSDVNCFIDGEAYREWVSQKMFSESRRQLFVTSVGLESTMDRLTEFASTSMDDCAMDSEDEHANIQAYSVSNLLRKKQPVVAHYKSILVLTGDRGAGKSTLISNWINLFCEENPEITVVSHYTGSSSRSTDISIFLRRCIAELREEYLKSDIDTDFTSCSDEDEPRTFQEVCEAFVGALHLGPCVLVIDGIDELGSTLGLTPQEVKEFSWLPPVLPSQCRIIFSTCRSDLSFRSLTKRPDVQIANLPVFETEKSKKELLEEQMHQHFKHLSKGQLKQVFGIKLSSRPLFLSILGAEMTAFKVYQDLPTFLENSAELCRSVRDLYVRCFQRWTKDYSWSHDSTGSDEGDDEEFDYTGWVPDVLRLLAVSRDGLTQAELFTILDEMGYTGGQRVHNFDWLRFRRCMGNAVYEKPNGQLYFSHQHMKEIVEYVLLRSVKPASAEIISRSEIEKNWKEQKKSFHKHLAQHFLRKQLSQRCIEELPWQLLMAGDVDKLCHVLTDPVMVLKFLDDLKQNPSNRNDLHFYWHILEREGLSVTTKYKDLLVRIGVLQPENIDTESVKSDGVSEEGESSVKAWRPSTAATQEKPTPLFTPIIIPAIYTSAASDRDLSVIEEALSAADSDTDIRKTPSIGEADKDLGSELTNKDDHLQTDQTLPDDVETIFLTEEKRPHTSGQAKTSDLNDRLLPSNKVATLAWHIASLIEELGHHQDAEKIVQALNDYLQKNYPLTDEDQLIHAKAQQKLGNCCCNHGDAEQAERYYKKSLRTVMDMYEVVEDSPVYPEVLNLKACLLCHLGNLRLDSGSLDYAEDLFKEGLECAADCGNIATRGMLMYSMGLLRIRQDDFLLAETSLRQSLTVREQWFGKSHPLVANTLFALAGLMATPSNNKGYDKMAAEAAYRRALQIRETFCGSSHLQVAAVLFELGKLLKDEPSYTAKSESVRLLRRALDIRTTCLGGDHIDTRSVRQFLNELEVRLKMGQYEFGPAPPTDVRTHDRPYSSLSWRDKDLINIQRKARSQATSQKSASRTTGMSRPTSREDLMNRPTSRQSSMSYLSPSERLMMESERPRLLNRQSVDRRLRHVSLTEPEHPVSEPDLPGPESSEHIKKLTVEIKLTDDDRADTQSVEPLIESFAAEIDEGSVISRSVKSRGSKENLRFDNENSEIPLLQLYERYGRDKGAKKGSSSSPKPNVKAKGRGESARSFASSHITGVSGVTSTASLGTFASAHSHQLRCEVPGPHSLSASNTQSTTRGPHSSLQSLLGPARCPRDISTGIHHKSAWYHIPGRYPTADKRYPPKRSQKRPEVNSISKSLGINGRSYRSGEVPHPYKDPDSVAYRTYSSVTRGYSPPNRVYNTAKLEDMWPDREAGDQYSFPQHTGPVVTFQEAVIFD